MAKLIGSKDIRIFLVLSLSLSLFCLHLKLLCHTDILTRLTRSQWPHPSVKGSFSFPQILLYLNKRQNTTSGQNLFMPAPQVRRNECNRKECWRHSYNSLLSFPSPFWLGKPQIGKPSWSASKSCLKLYHWYHINEVFLFLPPFLWRVECV